MSSSHPSRPALAFLVLLAVMALLPTAMPTVATSAVRRPALAAARQLNPEGTTVSDYAISAVDSRAVFLAAPLGSQAEELYSTPLAGGEALKLNPSLAPLTSVAAMSVSPAGGQAVYLARHAGESHTSLYRVPTGGGAPAPLASSQGLGEAISERAPIFSPDGSYVLFYLQTSPTGPLPLYRVATAGGAPEKIDDSVTRLAFAPDSSRVVYIAGTATSELRSAPLDGRAPPVTLGPVIGDTSFLVSPDGSRVVYPAFEPVGLRTALVSQPIAGGTRTPLFSADNGGPSLDQFTLSHDGDRVLYSVRSTGSNNETVMTLYAAPTPGGERTQLAQVVSTPGSSATLPMFPGPNGRVVYIATTFSPWWPEYGGSELRSVLIDGSGPALLQYFTHSRISSVLLNRDGSRAAFINSAGIYVVPSDGGGAVGVGQGPVIGPPQLSDDGRLVFLTADALSVATFDGASVRPVDLPAGVTLRSFALLGDTALALGEAGQATGLYASDLPLLTRSFLPLLRR